MLCDTRNFVTQFLGLTLLGACAFAGAFWLRLAMRPVEGTTAVPTGHLHSSGAQPHSPLGALNPQPPVGMVRIAGGEFTMGTDSELG